MTTTVPDTLTGDYTIDASHSRIGFVARHAMVTKVRGSFNEFEGTATVDGDNPANSSVRVTIELSAGRPAPSTAASRPQPRSRLREVGEENHSGVEPLHVLEFAGLATDPYGNVRAGYEGTASLNRSDYGVSFNAALDTGGVLVSDKINLELDVSAIKDVA